MDQPPTVPRADALLNAPGLASATLTPVIHALMHDMASGVVLEVRSDDPSAREGVPAWSRLTGNPLLTVVADGAFGARYYLRRK